MHPTELSATALTQTYGDRRTETRALDAVSLTIGAHGPEAVAVMGPSGSGKTTLLHALAGIIAPTAGSVLWRGRDLAALSDRDRTRLRRSDFGFVFQQGQLLPELPAVENVALPLMLGGTRRGAAEAHASGILSQLGLGDMLHRRPGELSGGQAQRVAIARALVGSPGVVFADEPTGSLDQATGAQVMALLTQSTLRAGASLVVVTHDQGVADSCTRIVRLQDGRIVSDAPGAGRALQAPAFGAQGHPAQGHQTQGYPAQGYPTPAYAAPTHQAPAQMGAPGMAAGAQPMAPDASCGSMQRIVHEMRTHPAGTGIAGARFAGPGIAGPGFAGGTR